MPGGHNGASVSEAEAKGSFPAKQLSCFAKGEMAHFEFRIRSVPPFQAKRAEQPAGRSATIERARMPENNKKAGSVKTDPELECGSDLLSRAVSSQVPSAC